MKLRILVALLLIFASSTLAQANDWQGISIPVKLGDGQEWALQEGLSDDFNYTFKPTIERATIGGKWINFYHSKWEGPGTTKWRHENVAVANGKLYIRSSRKPGETKTFHFDQNKDGQEEPITLPATRAGCISSINQVKYPAYVEARVKIANAVLASNVWMLSSDATQEIDICEAYGGLGDDKRNDYHARRIHVSHHVFIRKPFQDYQPKDGTTWHPTKRKKPLPGEGYWTNRFIRLGVYWRDPTHLEYYLNGKLIKTTSGLDGAPGSDGIDPLGHTKDATGQRTGLSKPLDIIINMEAQDWNAAAGRVPTDEEIARKEDHTFLVDWIRVYRPK